jgi:Flp pilus assembly protein TadB
VAQITSSIREQQLRKALEYMRNALQLLDDAEAPMEIGAHLDYAICRMSDDMPDPIPDLQ